MLIADAVPNSLPLPAGSDHAGASQYAQVLGDQRLGQPEVLDELSHGVLPDGEQVHDGGTHRIRQSLEEAADRLVLGDLRAGHAPILICEFLHCKSWGGWDESARARE